MQGRLMHATHGIPNGKALLSPLVALVAKHHHNQRAHIQLDQATTQSLWDWQAILKTSSASLTLCSDLVPAPPDYTGYCDASKMGAGGIWFGANKQLPAIVSRISFPDDIHATHGIPNGKALLSPLVALVAKHHNNWHAHIQLDQATTQSLRDWQAILKTSTANPTLCSDLVPAPPDYTGYCDASKMGAGGMWFGANKQLPAIVWRISFPDDIQEQICSDSNPLGTLTNSDLEMAGLVCQWLVLECLADLQHCHVAVGCDNTPTVAWASRLLSSKAKTAAHLLRALAIRMLACQATPLTAYHIPGVLNTMADVASRSLVSQPSDREFLTLFNARFPLEQDTSWTLCTLSSKTVGKLYSTLRTTTSPLVWWQRTTRNASVTGGTGETSFGPLSTRIFKTYIQMKKFPSSKPLVNGPDKETSVAANKSKRVRFKMPSEQSERASNWLASTTLCTSQEPPAIT